MTENYCTKFAADGVLVIENIVGVEMMNELHAQAMSNFAEVQSIISAKNLSFGISAKNGFQEIVERHPKRFEMPYKMDMPIFNEFVAESPIIAIVKEILETEVVSIVNKSLIVSMPGSQEQAWHIDGPHLSTTTHHAPHVLNVFIPLIDVTMEDGPTEIRPGSQFFTRDLSKQYMAAFLTKKLRPTISPCLKKGSVVMFDYRVLHRGLPNTSNRPRPCLVFTFARPWYKDVLNFPRRSIFDDEEVNEEVPRLPTDDTVTAETAAAAQADTPPPPPPPLS